MKQFGKWYNELSMREDATDFTVPTYKKYRKGWRAALERVLEQEYDYHGPTAYDFIRKELKGGD